MDIFDELAAERFEEYSEERSASVEEFLADPTRYLAIAARRDGAVRVMQHGKVAFVIRDGADHLLWLDQYFMALRKSGDLAPELAAIVERDEKLANPVGNA